MLFEKTYFLFRMLDGLSGPDTIMETYKRLLRPYFFYLSFENTRCKNYITEKFYDVLATNEAIPIGRYPWPQLIHNSSLGNCCVLIPGPLKMLTRAFRTSESESENFGLWKPFGLGLSVFFCLRIYTLKKSTFHKKNPKFQFLPASQDAGNRITHVPSYVMFCWIYVAHYNIRQTIYIKVNPWFGTPIWDPDLGPQFGTLI
jgi:hypothetical protein